MYFKAAFNIAGFSQTLSDLQASSISLAPRKNSSISKPMQAAVVRPTSVNTVKRPPTPSGTENCGQLWSIAICFNNVGFSRLGSVTATTSTSICGFFFNAS